jgi:hypothetical protein
MALPPGDGDGRGVAEGDTGEDETTVLPPIDGDPALVRPYVRAAEAEIETGVEAETAVGAAAGTEAADREPMTPGPASASAPQVWAADVESTTVLPPVPRAPAAPRRIAAAPAPAPDRPEPSGSRRRKVLALAGGAVALILIGTGAALLTLPSAAPAVQAATPSTDAASASATAGEPSARPSPSSSASPSGPPKPSPKPSRRPSPTARRSPSASASPSGTPSAQATSLSLGSSGPAVVALQQDLRQLWIDRRDPTGTYDDRTAQDVTTFQTWYNVQGDPAGVYGPHSQAKMAQVLGRSGNGGNGNNGSGGGNG